MQIIPAKYSGFCFGVKRAVELVEKELKEHGRVYTLGEIIHNGTVVEELRSRGAVAEEKIEAIPNGATVVIRSHGTGEETYRLLKEKSIRIIDATCPFVKRIQTIVRNAHASDKTVLIFGKANHPEIIGINGWCENTGIVLNSLEECEALPYGLCAEAVVQTTFERATYEALLSAVRPHCDSLTVHDTICDTTSKRQQEAEELSKIASLMVIVGGRHSSNTQKLAAICKKNCKYCISIENPCELPLEIIPSDGIIGIVAGASTPDWIIREVITSMSELEKTMAECPEVEVKDAAVAVEEPTAAAPAADTTEANFAEAFEKTLVRIRNGQIIKGSVVQIVDGEVCVNIGYKSDGFIPRSEFSSDADVNPADVVKVGDEIEVEVLKVNDGEGNVLLSRKSVEGKKLWDEFMADAETEGKVFEGVGKEVVKGGLIASISGVRAFIPASQVSTKYVENLAEFVGKPLKLKVIEVDKSRKRIVASQKAVLVAEAEAAKKQKWAELVVGEKMHGVVRRLTDFGAFVDIGGIDGLVHVTDIAWGRVKHPSDVLKIGQEIEVLVLNVDTEKERVSLGYKQLQPKPWTMAAEKYPVGSIVEGKVVRIVPFGAFVALEPTIDGLIHISQVDVRRIAKVEDSINVGDVVRCKVLDVNPEAKRISLSRKDVILEENPEIAEEIAKERAERERVNAERAAQRAAQSEQQNNRSNSSEHRQERTERAERTERTERSERSDRPERSERRSRREDADYQLPPVEKATTSLADLFSGFKVEE